MIRNLYKSFGRASFTRAFASKGEYDLAVIGGGPGGKTYSIQYLGYVAAIKAGQKGMKTICIEKRGSLGGTCLNVGCIPSKALLNATNSYKHAKHMFPKLGIKTEKLGYDIKQIMKQKEEAVVGLTKGIETLFRKNKVDYAKGTGSFVSKNEIAVKLNGGGNEKIFAKNIIIATGSDVSPLPGEPLKIDEKIVVSSTGALSLKEVPKKMIVIGAGVIGLELGSVYQGLGAEVTVVEYMDKIMPFADGEISAYMTKLFTKEGFKFLLGHKVVGGQVGEKSAKVIIEENKSGQKRELEADIVLVATGRRPYTAELKAAEIGILLDKQGRVEINDHLQVYLAHYLLDQYSKHLRHRRRRQGSYVGS
jgi:dihydrolipoamide dehydrogenase